MASSEKLINYYKVLGVPEYASCKQIKQTYLILSRRMKRDYENRATGKSIRLNADDILEAYAVLSSKERRQKFDQMLAKKRSVISYKVTTSVHDLAIQKEFESVSYGEKLYRKGLACMLAGHHKEALKYFRKLLTFEKSNPLIYYNLSRAYFMGEAYTFAAKSVRQAIKLNPKNENFHLLLGQIYEKRNKPFTARKCYLRAYELNPKNPQVKVQYDRGSIFIENISKKMGRILFSFIPDAKARSFRYKEGLLTKEMVRDFFRTFFYRLRPLPINETFRYTGRW